METHCKGDTVVLEITPLQNFQLYRYTLSVGFF